METKFTKQELQNWKAYERVRAKGRWNMFDARARSATGMNREEYVFVMDNYKALKTAVEAAK